MFYVVKGKKQWDLRPHTGLAASARYQGLTIYCGIRMKSFQTLRFFKEGMLL
jgi:hypothetical protein